MKLDNKDFGTLAVCAIRYCRGRQTCMPSLVRGIVKGHIKDISDKDLQVLINDCDYTMRWADVIESKEWTEWRDVLTAEQERRKKND